MSSIYEKIDNRLETFLSTLKRFPFASFSAFLITMIFLVLVDGANYNSPNVIIASKVAFVASLGIVLFPALQLLSRLFIFPLLGLLVLGIYYYCLPHNIDDANDIVFVRHLLMSIALFFMIIWAPFIAKKSDNDTFWQYAQAIIFGLIIAIFFSIIIFAGLSAALYAIEELFNFKIWSTRYEQLSIIIFGIFGLNFFLSQIPKHPLFMQVRPYSKIKRIFSKNILAPLALVYFIILYAYTAKILLTMTWPTGTLSWIIVAFSFVAIVSFLFLSPYLKRSSLTQRLIWLAIFLQTIMLAMALSMRVEEYGITYNRYLLGLFGLYLTLMSLYFMLFGKAQQKWLFFFASLFILISQFGPYSAANITQESQTQRLVKLIETAHPRSEKLSMKKKYEISDGLRYIEQHYGVEAFEKIIPHILKKYKLAKIKNKIAMKEIYFSNFSDFATKELGFKSLQEWEWRSFLRGDRRENHTQYLAKRTHPLAIEISNYDVFTKYHYYHGDISTRPKIKDANFTISFKNNEIKIENQEKLLFKLSMKTLVESLNNQNARKNLPQESMSLKETQNGKRVKVLFQNIKLMNEHNITSFTSIILLEK